MGAVRHSHSGEIPTATNTLNTRSNSPLIVDSVNDLPLPPPSSLTMRPMTTEFDWDEDDDSIDSWYDSDEGEYDLLNDPLIQQMSVMVESEMDDRASISYSEHDEGSTIVSTTSDAVDQLRADIQQRIDSGTIHRGGLHDQLSLVVPNPCILRTTDVCRSRYHPLLSHLRSGHVFFAPSAQIPIPDSPESPPMSEQGTICWRHGHPSITMAPAADRNKLRFHWHRLLLLSRHPFPGTSSLIEELSNTCVICGMTYWNVLEAAATLWSRNELAPMGKGQSTKLAKRECLHYGLRVQAAFIIRGGVSQVATCDGSNSDIWCIVLETSQ